MSSQFHGELCASCYKEKVQDPLDNLDMFNEQIEILEGNKNGNDMQRPGMQIPGSNCN